MPATSEHTSEPFSLGGNYWPRRKAMGWWSDFDTGEVRDEFDVIRELRLGVVRIFLLWDDFQPTPTRVKPSAMSRLTETCDIAAERGLKLDVTFFTGHMSGSNWVPAWLLDGSPTKREALEVVSRGRVVAGEFASPYVNAVALDRHERHFGLVRQDGTLKPHALVLRDFAASKPVIQRPSERETMHLDPNVYYGDPMRHLRDLYHRFESRREVRGVGSTIEWRGLGA